MSKNRVYVTVNMIIGDSNVMLIPQNSGEFVNDRKDNLVATNLFLSPSIGMFSPEIYLSIDPLMRKHIPEVISEEVKVLENGMISINYMVSFSFSDEAVGMKEFILLDGLPVFVEVDARTINVPFAFAEFDLSKSLEDAFSTDRVYIKMEVLSTDEAKSAEIRLVA